VGVALQPIDLASQGHDDVVSSSSFRGEGCRESSAITG